MIYKASCHHSKLYNFMSKKWSVRIPSFKKLGILWSPRGHGDGEKEKKRDGRCCKITFQCFCILSQLLLCFLANVLRSLEKLCVLQLQQTQRLSRELKCIKLNFFLQSIFFLTITMSSYGSVEYTATWTTFIGYLCPF